MEEVKAYKCEKCKGKGYIEYTTRPYTVAQGDVIHNGTLHTPKCPTCNGDKKVWLTENEVKDKTEETGGSLGEWLNRVDLVESIDELNELFEKYKGLMQTLDSEEWERLQVAIEKKGDSLKGGQ